MTSFRWGILLTLLLAVARGRPQEGHWAAEAQVQQLFMQHHYTVEAAAHQDCPEVAGRSRVGAAG